MERACQMPGDEFGSRCGKPATHHADDTLLCDGCAEQKRERPITRHHMCQSVDADRFNDRYLAQNVVPFLNPRPVSVRAFRRMCAEARAKGLQAFPPCDHTTPTGHCAGHPIPVEPLPIEAA